MQGITKAPATEGRQAIEEWSQLALVLERCFSRICSWRTPPNWSNREWFEEIKAHAIAASCRAICEYDAARGVPQEAFVYQRVIARVLTRHRQEWAYALRFASHNGSEKDEDIDSSSAHDRSDAIDLAQSENQCAIYDELKHAIASLSESNRWLITQLFWNEQTEVDIAYALGIGRRAVNKRKHTILQSLHELLVRR
jgi:DNA-directed RNA polymerase specialized sigma24 family protein